MEDQRSPESPMEVEYKTGFVPAPGALVVAVVGTIALVGVAVAAVWFGAGFWIKAVCILLAAAVVVGFPARFRRIRINQWNKQRRLAGGVPGQGKQKALEDLRGNCEGVEAIGSEELPQLLAENPHRPHWEGFPDQDEPTGIGRAFIERYLAGSKQRRRS
ncbi:MAG: hypothetical protein F4015_03625 [Acidimicrobiia bacterium]|nr:hypothetical protein [Acidimicrobiia bacterium]